MHVTAANGHAIAGIEVVSHATAPGGEIQNRPFQLSFNSSVKVDFQGSRVTSDACLLLVRELHERLGLSQLISDNLIDARRGKNTQLPLPDMLRQPIYSRLAGYEDLNDAERLSQDPTFRLIGSEKIRNRGVRTLLSYLNSGTIICGEAAGPITKATILPSTSALTNLLSKSATVPF